MKSGIRAEALSNSPAAIVAGVGTAEVVTARLLGWLLVVAWLTVAGVALVWGWQYYATPIASRPLHPMHDQLKPAGSVGLGYGVIGTSLILIGVSIYSARKRLPLLRKWGRLSDWLGVHIFLCTLGPFLVLLHTSFRFGGIVSIAFWSMAAVTASGIFGRYVYGHIPRTIQGHTVTRRNVQQAKAELIDRVARRFPDDIQPLRDLLLVGAAPAPRGLVHALWLSLRFDMTKRWRRRRLRGSLSHTAIPSALQSALVTAVSSQITLEQQIALLSPFQRMFRYWHLFHLPLTLVMALILGLHITVAVLLGYTWIF